MRWKLALTYNLRQDPADPLDVVVRQPRVEGQGERPGEAGIRVLERALVAVGAQAMEGVRSDLRLDSFAAERGERVVAAVELDDVRLPAVLVALVGRRGRDDAAQALRVRLRDAPTRYTSTICTRWSVTSGASRSRIARTSVAARSIDPSERAIRVA